jgi:hypothetical protein
LLAVRPVLECAAAAAVLRDALRPLERGDEDGGGAGAAGRA